MHDVLNQLENLNLDVPPAFAEAVHKRNSLWAEVSDLVGHRDPGAVPIERMAVRPDQIDVAAFRRAVLESAQAAAATKAWKRIESQLDRACSHALIEAGDDLVEQSQPRFTKAVDVVENLVKILGPTPSADEAVASGHVKEYVQWPTAAAELATASAIMTLLGESGTTKIGFDHMPRRGPGYFAPVPACYLAGTIDAAAYDRAVNAYQDGGLVAMINLGYPLTMNTADVTRSIVDAIAAEKAKVAAEQAEAATKTRTDAQIAADNRIANMWQAATIVDPAERAKAMFPERVG